MHSFAKALLAFAVAILAVKSAADNSNSPSSSPTCQVKVLNINRFQKQQQHNGNVNDEVSMRLNITADLESLFAWNTKQVFVFVAAEYETRNRALNQISLWDRIISTKQHAKFSIRANNKYRYVDQGSNLRGKEFNLTLHWQVMSKVGQIFAGKITTPGNRLPKQYV